MKSPLVDIVIPCFNTGRYLAQAIDSALAQTYRPIHVVVVDDGSTDNTGEIAQSYGTGVTYIHQENRGLPGARNTGLRNSYSEYVAFLDADDVILPSKIADQVHFLLENPDADIVFSNTLLVWGDRLDQPLVDWRPFRQWEDYCEPFTMMCAFPSHAPLLRRSLFDRHGLFREEMTIGCEDWEFWLRCILEGAVIRHLPKFHALYRKHSGSMTSELWALERQETALIQRAAEMFDRYGVEDSRRRKLLSCGIRFMAMRCLILDKRSEFDNLVKLSRSVVRQGALPENCWELFEPDREVPYPILYVALSRELMDMGRPDLATFCLLHAGDVREVSKQAEISGQAELFETTLELFDEFLMQDPSSQVTAFGKSGPAEYNPDSRDSLSALECSIGSHWTYTAYLWHLLGRFFASRGRLKEAGDRLGKAVILNPNERFARFDHADFLFRVGDLVGAERECRRSIDLGLETPYGHFLLAEILYKSGDLVGAERECRRSIDLGLETPYGYFLLAEVLYKKGDFQGAMENVWSTLHLDPDHFDGRLLATKLVAKTGQYGRAAAQLMEACRIDPQSLADVMLASACGQLRDQPARKRDEACSEPFGRLARKCLSGFFRILGLGYALARREKPH